MFPTVVQFCMATHCMVVTPHIATGKTLMLKFACMAISEFPVTDNILMKQSVTNCLTRHRSTYLELNFDKFTLICQIFPSSKFSDIAMVANI